MILSLCVILCSNEVDDQIEYAVFTREMYELCGISSGGFCTGVCSYVYSIGNQQLFHILFSFFRLIHHHILMLLTNVLELEIHSMQMTLA